MNVDLLWIVGALIFPLVGVAFSMLKNRVDRVEEAAGQSNERMHAEIKDLQRYVRHEQRDINSSQISSLTDDKRLAVDRLIQTMEIVTELLQNKGVDEVAKRRNFRDKEAG